MRLRIGDVLHTQAALPLSGPEAAVKVGLDAQRYTFFVETEEGAVELCSAQTRYVSTEVNCGFTGVLMALYAQGGNTAEFTQFTCRYEEE